jgi:hypothetical protein
MEKHGMLTEDSHSDTDTTKKAAFVEKNGHTVADAANKKELKEPDPVAIMNGGPLGMFGGGTF